MSARRRVLLIEDEEGIAAAIEYQLASRNYDVVHLTDGLSGLDRFRSEGADLVLLDLMLPGMPGEQVCREIRRTSDVPIIMLTAKDAESEKVRGLEIGADDYLTKPFSTPELLARIGAVLRRSRPRASENVLVAGTVEVHPDRFEVTRAGRPVPLRLKEFELLVALMSRRGRVVTREDLIASVWGPDYYGDTRTLDVHIKRLRTKLEDDPHNPRMLVTVRGVGYKCVP